MLSVRIRRTSHSSFGVGLPFILKAAPSRQSYKKQQAHPADDAAGAGGVTRSREIWNFIRIRPLPISSRSI